MHLELAALYRSQLACMRAAACLNFGGVDISNLSFAA